MVRIYSTNFNPDNFYNNGMIEDAGTIEAITYFERLITEQNRIAVDESENLDF